jgi:hypothetical protein
MSIEQETRRESYAEINKTSMSWGRIILNAIRTEGAGSAWQIAQALGRPVYVVRPRLSELKDEGLIKAVGKRWCENTQRREAIWDLVEGQGDLFR